MKRSGTVVLGSVMVLATTTFIAWLVLKPDEDPDHAQICVNAENVRVDDDECDDDNVHSSGTHWFYAGRGLGAPPVGSKIDTTTGSFTRPASGKISTVSRGGFGGRSSAGGGGS